MDSRLKPAAALAWCALLTWWAYGHGSRIPLLAQVDLGFHELGHLVFYIVPSGDLITAAAGSAFQMGVPAGLAAYFLAVRHDRVAASVCLAWAATSARDVAVYVADAPYERLPLIGGQHDWAYILGPEQLDRLDQAGRYAHLTRGLGLALALAAAGLALDALVSQRKQKRPTPPPRVTITPIDDLVPGDGVPTPLGTPPFAPQQPSRAPRPSEGPATPG